MDGLIPGFRSVVTRSTFLHTCCIMRADAAMLFVVRGKRWKAEFEHTDLQLCWPLKGVIAKAGGLAADANA